MESKRWRLPSFFVILLASLNIKKGMIKNDHTFISEINEKRGNVRHQLKILFHLLRLL
jgi:hypothetical protein